MNKHQKALQHIKKIVEENNITWNEVNKILQNKEEPKPKPGPIEASEILAYMGGILIFAGLGVYTIMFWQELSSFVRVSLTLGVGISCYCIALGLSQNLKYKKASDTLFVISAFLQPTGLYVLLNELFPTSSDIHIATLFVFGLMLVQQLATFWKLRLNLFLCLGIFFSMGFTFTLLDYASIKLEYILMCIGASLFLFNYSLNGTPHRSITGFWYFIAASLFLGGTYYWLFETRFSLLFIGICAFVVYISAITKSKSILFVSTIALLSFIGSYTMIHFVDSIGWPISLILTGIAFIFLSGFAFKIKNKYMY